MSDSAEINLFEKIPLILLVVDKTTGQNIPTAILSGVLWHQDNEIVIIQPTDNPNIFLFLPQRGGVTKINCSAAISI